MASDVKLKGEPQKDLMTGLPTLIQSLSDFIVYWAMRCATSIVNLLPYKVRILLVTFIVRLVLFIAPKYRKIGILNLTRAFPEKSDAWRNSVMQECSKSFAKLIVDLLRLPSIGLKEANDLFDFPFRARLDQLRQDNIPVIYATGHLGSFEMLAHYLCVIGHPLSFVARKLNPGGLDQWWTEKREAHGNKVITRSGALKGVLRQLKRKQDIAVLFDQNVTRDHAVFVPWFGNLAATSKLIGLAALRTQGAVLVISMESLPNQKYRIHTVECDFRDIYNDQQMSPEEKVLRITAKVSSEYEAMIRENPGAWFWLHRRWKTTSEDTSETFYADV
jgi:Kdo2-lipid IVA lauroyltransferase/acyltransferase